MDIFSPNFKQLSQEVEADFLALGKCLYQFRHQAQAISEKAAGVSSRIAGSNLSDAVKSLKLFQKRIGPADGCANGATGTLFEIFDDFAEIDPPLKSLLDSIRFLNILCTEAGNGYAQCKEDRSDFDNAIRDLKSLGGALLANFEEFKMRITGMMAATRQSLLAVQTMEQHQSHQSNLILGQILSSIEPLRDKHRISADILRQFSIRYHAIFKNIGDIVECLQFHDITRQRVDHSASAIKSIESRLMNSQLIAGACGLANVIAIGRVQIIQLCQAKADLEYAARTAKNSLQNLSREIHEIIAAVRNLAGLARQHGESFLGNIERNLSSLQIATKNHLRIKTERQALLGSAVGRMDELSALAGDIQNIVTRIKSFAENLESKDFCHEANRYSAGLLAKGTQKLMAEANAPLLRISDILRSIAKSAHDLVRMEAGNSLDPLKEMGMLDAQFEMMIQHLKSADLYVEKALEEVETLSATLLGDVTEAMRLFNHPVAFLQEIDDVCTRLEAHIQRANDLVRRERVWEGGWNYREQGGCSDVNVQNLIFDMPSSSGTTSDPLNPLGDNVELF